MTKAHPITLSIFAANTPSYLANSGPASNCPMRLSFQDAPVAALFPRHPPTTATSTFLLRQHLKSSSTSHNTVLVSYIPTWSVMAASNAVFNLRGVINPTMLHPTAGSTTYKT
jgi:hypothetical protein